MRTLHFDCFNGASGDMLLGALLDLGVPQDFFDAILVSLGLPITLEVARVKRGGFACVQATVHAADGEDYRFLPDVLTILDKADLDPAARELAVAIFTRLAEAEATAHGMPIERVHFHEVGALDSIADIVLVAAGVVRLGCDRYTCSEIPTGYGTITCAHGVIPVPAPGTLALLKGVPLAKSEVKGELTTPTGAAIITTLNPKYVTSPVMTIDTVGVGTGSKDFIDRANILRLFLGESSGGPASAADTVVVLETNLDDVSPEVIGHATERLFTAGALDVFTVAVQMKKSRPGVLLTALATPESADALESIIFEETGTFGVRRSTATRQKLARTSVQVETPWGPVSAKLGTRGSHKVRTPEYEDCAAVARRHGVPLRAVYAAVTVGAVVGGELE